MQDEQAYYQGLYNLKAFEVVMAHFGAGLTGKTSHVEYFKNPIMQEADTEKNSNPESKEEVAVFEAKQRIELLRRQGLPESPM